MVKKGVRLRKNKNSRSLKFSQAVWAQNHPRGGSCERKEGRLAVTTVDMVRAVQLKGVFHMEGLMWKMDCGARVAAHCSTFYATRNKCR